MYSRLRPSIVCSGYRLWHRQECLWTSNNIVKSPCKDITIPNTTLIEYVWRNLDKWPSKTATVCGVTKRSYTYEQIHQHSVRLGAILRKTYRIQDGDAVAVILPNLPEYPAVVFGILSAGGVVSTINPKYTAHEVQRQLVMSQAKLVITTPQLIATVKEALQLYHTELPIITVTGDSSENAASFFELIGAKSVDTNVLKQVNREADDVCLLPSSSGTTGLPKGVEITNRNIVANCEQQNTEMRHFDLTTETTQDTTLVVLPFFHLFALSMMLIHKLSAGLKLVTLPGFQPKTFLDAMIEHKVNLLYAAPPTVLFLGSHPDVNEKHFEHLKALVCGAAPLPATDIQNVFKKAGRKLNFIQAYGLTETSPLATISPSKNKNYTSVGYALPNVELRVVDQDFFNLGPGKEGELLIKGPNVMRGYKDNPEATEEVFLPGGWFRTGDLAKIYQDGAVTITDRLKELIKVKGFQVPPAELEAVLKGHPSVLDAAVIGAPDEKTGECPIAFIVQKPGKIIDANTIIEFVNERVASYKRINDVVFVTSIPKNPSGKILRRVLRDNYCKD